jgi:hypothetical protein
MADKKRKLLQVPNQVETTMRAHAVAEPTQVNLDTQLSQYPALCNRQKTIPVKHWPLRSRFVQRTKTIALPAGGLGCRAGTPPNFLGKST